MMTAQSVFADFADFDVKLTVPGNYVVASSGDLIGGPTAGWGDVTIGGDARQPALCCVARFDSTPSCENPPCGTDRGGLHFRQRVHRTSSGARRRHLYSCPVALLCQ